MLPASARLTRHGDFAATIRRGRRAARGTVVVHLARSGDSLASPRVGFVVGRAVGCAVIRHQVQRRLRHLMRARLDALPGGALAVVRALPAAAGASSATLGEDLDAALRRVGAPGHILSGSSADDPVVDSPVMKSSDAPRDGCG